MLNSPAQSNNSNNNNNQNDINNNETTTAVMGLFGSRQGPLVKSGT